MLTKKDLGKIYEMVNGIVKETIKFEIDPMKSDLKELKDTVGKIQITTDKTLSLFKRHDGELSVLRARQNKMRTVLVQKGVGTEEEFALG